MKTIDSSEIKKHIKPKFNGKNKALMIVFVVMILLCLLFTGGALSVTIQYAEFTQSGWESGISWMWMPALLFFALSALTGWTLYSKKGCLETL